MGRNQDIEMPKVSVNEKIRWNYHSLTDILGGLVHGRSKSVDFILASYGFYIITVALLGPIVLALSWAMRLMKETVSKKAFYVTAYFSVLLGFIINAMLIDDFQDFVFSQYGLIDAIGAWYLVACSWVGVVAVMQEGFLMTAKFWRTSKAKNELEKFEEERQRAEETARNRASKTISQTVRPAHSLITLGSIIRGDTFPSSTKVENYRGWLRFDEKLLDKHTFILGTTGAGKTELILRLAYEVLMNTRRNLYIVDGKGEMKFAEVIATMAYEMRSEQVPIFKLGHLSKGAVYNGFSGNADSIYNRMAYMVGVMEAVSGEGRHYTEINKRLLQMVCLAGGDGEIIRERGQIDAPRSFEEILERLDYGWLKHAYSTLPMALRMIESAKEDRLITDLFTRVYNLSNSFGGIISPKGFTLENTRCAVFSLKTNSAGVEAKSLLDFLNSDIQDFIANRITKPSVMIIDEFGSFANENITNILSQSRSSELGVVLATQTVASLGEPHIRDKIIENCNTHIMMKTLKGESIAEIAGTRMGGEMSIQMKEGQETGIQSMRLQHQMKTHPQEAKELQAGEAFFINSGKAAKIMVAKVDGLKSNPKAIASNIYSRDTGEFKGVEVGQNPEPPAPQRAEEEEAPPI